MFKPAEPIINERAKVCYNHTSEHERWVTRPLLVTTARIENWMVESVSKRLPVQNSRLKVLESIVLRQKTVIGGVPFPP